MAQYIRFRLTAAKVGVSLALAALIAGIAEKAQSAPTVIRARQAAVDSFLKLDGIGGQTKLAFQKVELKYYKLHTALLKLEGQLSNVYLKDTINAKFLKIDAANTEFLKIDDANAEYLKIADASAKFLKIDATAANSNELGGLTPDAFFQGHGNVVSGEATVSSQAGPRSAPLLATPDGLLSVTLDVNADGVPSLVINNGGDSALPAVQELGKSAVGSPSETSTLSSTGLPQGTSTIPLGNDVDQLHLQIFPAGNSTHVTTLTVSVEPGATAGTFTAVGQMLNGGT